eukprot:CCRYP_014313-RA/>CCRYP_014313-RA protein AED:0.44 eAED:0.44 QI:0/0/0/1/1/1/2/0/242
MLDARAFRKLKSMGLFQCGDDIDILHNAPVFCTVQVGDNRHQQDRNIASLLLYNFSLILHSVLDVNSCAWFDRMSDKVMGQYIFRLNKGSKDDLAERVLNGMREIHGKSGYHAQMFRVLYQAGTEEDEVLRTMLDFCVRLPCILITPLQMSVTGFEVDMSNQLVQKFVDKFGFSQKAFMRVSLVDENRDKLFSDDLSHQVETRIKNLVLNGITIGKKKYTFLVYSSSQLKEQSLWMVCPEHG